MLHSNIVARRVVGLAMTFGSSGFHDLADLISGIDGLHAMVGWLQVMMLVLASGANAELRDHLLGDGSTWVMPSHSKICLRIVHLVLLDEAARRVATLM